MSFDTENFIIDLVKQLNLKNMDGPRRARLEDLYKKGVATSKQKAWWELGKKDNKTMAWDAPTINAKEGEEYIYANGETEAPEPKVLEDLYLKLVVIMREMAADKDLIYENSAVKKFLEEFYGNNKAISPFVSEKLNNDDSTNIAGYITNNKIPLSNSLKIKESDLDYLVQHLNNNDYTSDTKSLRLLNDFLSKIYDWDIQGGERLLPKKSFPRCLGNEGKPDYDNVAKLIKTINTHANINDDQLTKLHNNIPNLFNKLVFNEKLLTAFIDKDSEGVVKKWINKGLNETNYKDGANALAPKYADRKTFWKNAESNVKNFYVDTLGKMNEKHTRHIYSTDARFIVPELIKEGITPASGTKNMLDAFDKISGNLPNPVQEKLKWVKETLTSMSGTTMFKDALHDGRQMRALVKNIIDTAVDNGGKEDEAMVALEILALMRYTMMTSSVRDKVKEASAVNLFSDKDLSWNKNEGMRLVTNAIDGTISLAIRGAFEVANVVKNAINQEGLRFKKDKQKTTEGEAPAEPDEKEEMKNKLRAFWNFVNSSSNTKDYNIFRSHKNLQKKLDKENDDGNTEMMQRFQLYQDKFGRSTY